MYIYIYISFIKFDFQYVLYNCMYYAMFCSRSSRQTGATRSATRRRLRSDCFFVRASALQSGSRNCTPPP